MKTALNLLLLVCISGSVLAQTIPRDTTYNVKKVHSQIRKEYPYAIPAADSIRGNVKEYRDVIYLTLENTPYGKRDLKVDIFQPKKAGKHPAVLFVHGGGWRSGDKSMEVPMAQLLAAKGYVTVAVEYQLSLEAKYPAAVHNLKAAVRWLKANAEKYGVDTSRIAISGTSAGGQLASLIGLSSGSEKLEGKMGKHTDFSSDVHAAMDIDGVISFIAPASLNLKRKSDSPDIEWLGGSFEEKPEIWREASAGYWANEKSIPMLFLNSGFSRFHAGQDELVGQFKEWGVYHEVHKFNVNVHPFWLFHPWVDETVNYMDNFLKIALKK